MKQHLSSIISYGIATTGLLLMFNSAKAQSDQPLTESTPKPTNQIINNLPATFPNATTNSPNSNLPKRLSITVKIADPTDLKIKEDDYVSQGQIIADRTMEKQRLESQYQQLKLALARLEKTTITPPVAPSQVPTISALPPISYLEEEANVEAKKTAIASVELEVNLNKAQIEYLSSIPNIDPIILEHENAKLAQLQLKHTSVVREYQIAVAKLQTAKEKRAYDEHQNQVQQANRLEQINQAKLSYQNQLAQYEQRLADKEYNLTQLKTELNQVENQIASVATVKSPYTGTVRRIQWLGQAPDGSLTADITLMVSQNN